MRFYSSSLFINLSKINASEVNNQITFESYTEQKNYYDIDIDEDTQKKKESPGVVLNQPVAPLLRRIVKQTRMDTIKMTNLPDKGQLHSLLGNLSKSRYKRIEVEDYGGPASTTGSYQTLVHLLKTQVPHTHVKHLVIKTYKLTAKQIKDLSSTFRNLLSLTICETASWTDRSSERARELSKRLKYCKKLNEFSFISLRMDEDVRMLIIKSLKHVPLKKLCLSGYAVSDQTIFALREAGILPKLKELTLPFIRISDLGLNELAKNCKNVKKLYLGNNNLDDDLGPKFTDQGIAAFFLHLANTSIEKLHLYGYEDSITTAALKPLAKHLASKLKFLDLRCSATYANVSYLLKQLSRNDKIEELYLGNKNISKTDVNLLKVILNNQKLRYLDISWCNEADSYNQHVQFSREMPYKKVLKDVADCPKHHSDLKTYANEDAFLFPVSKKTEKTHHRYDQLKKKLLNSFRLFKSRNESHCIEIEEIPSHSQISNQVHYSNRPI